MDIAIASQEIHSVSIDDSIDAAVIINFHHNHKLHHRFAGEVLKVVGSLPPVAFLDNCSDSTAKNHTSKVQN
jgi:hypothetical protein